MERIKDIKKIQELVYQLNIYRDAYYNNSESQISDYEYDTLFDELKQLEEQTGVIMANSPTQTVGYEIKSKLEKVKHSHPMLSLAKTKSIDDLVEFAQFKNCLLSLKMDGLTVLLTYEDGKLIQAESRGDGETGELITHNARVFENIPLNIDYKGHLEVEGEAIITYSDFEKINSELPEADKYKNPRNLVSGSVRQLDSHIAAERHIRFVVWKVPTEKSFMNIGFQNMRDMGFTVVPYYLIKENCSKSEIENAIEKLKKDAKGRSFPIDGLVMSYNDIEFGKYLGMTSHHPRHSIAFKFYEDEEEATLTDIKWQVGKTGVITPVAYFTPVELAGTTVEKASLHNISIIEKLKLGIGDSITVYKSNEIIPQIRDNLTKSNTWVLPDKCPNCGGDVEVHNENGSKTLHCTNSECSAKLLGKLTHFASKNAANIDGLSEQTLQKFISLGWLNTFKDIYKLSEHRKTMMKLDGFGKKSVDKLLDAIEKSRDITLDRFLYALSIPLIGRTASKDIAKYCHNSVDEFVFIIQNTSLEFATVDGIGTVATCSLDDWWHSNCDMFYDLIEEFAFDDLEVKSGGVDLSEKVFVITGFLTHYKNRDELVQKIEQLGGKVSGSVSAKTNYLINNDKESASSKNQKAKKLGISIISENDFVKMIGEIGDE